MADVHSEAELQKLKVPDLKKLLKERGLAVGGNKAELIARLQGQESGGHDPLDGGLEEETNDELLGDDFDDDVDTDVLNEITETQLLSPTEKQAPSLSTTKKPALPEAPKQPAAVKITAAAPAVAAAAKVTAPAAGSVAGGKIVTGVATDKMSERLKRFGAVSLDAKKQSRADRFGVNGNATSTASASASSTNKSTSSNILSQSAQIVAEQEKLAKRSERFGTSATAAAAGGSGGSNKLSSAGPAPDVDTLKKRAERFGQSTSSVLTKVNEQERLLKRKNRFGTVIGSGDSNTTLGDPIAVEAKKMKRAERFGLTVS